MSRELHGGLAVAKRGLHFIVGRAQETGLEGLQGDQFLEFLTSLDKCRICEGARSGIGGAKSGLTADAGGEIRPHVHAGPLVSFAQGDGGDAGSFKGLYIRQKFGPGRGRCMAMPALVKRSLLYHQPTMPISHGTP